MNILHDSIYYNNDIDEGTLFVEMIKKSSAYLPDVHTADTVRC